MLPKAGAQNTEIVINQEAQNTTFPCPGAYVRSILPEYTSETYPKGPVAANLAVVPPRYCDL